MKTEPPTDKAYWRQMEKSVFRAIVGAMALLLLVVIAFRIFPTGLKMLLGE